MSTKNYYICTAIAYVNDKAHVGHAMDFIYADVLARYQRQLGSNVLFSIGTDEHGTKIAEKALEAGLEPQAFADSIVPQWQEFAKLAGVSNDRFVRTTDPNHCRCRQWWAGLCCCRRSPPLRSGSEDGCPDKYRTARWRYRDRR